MLMQQGIHVYISYPLNLNLLWETWCQSIYAAGYGKGRGGGSKKYSFQKFEKDA